MGDVAPGDGWASITDLARLRGVTKQSLAERVDRLVKLGRLVTRPGPGRSRLVEVAAFDRATAEVGDAQRTANGGGKASPALAFEQARRAKTAADLAELDLAERVGILTFVSEVEEAGIWAVTEMRAAFAFAVNDTADAVAADLGVEANRIRPHLRGLERAALETFVAQLDRRLVALKKPGKPHDG